MHLFHYVVSRALQQVQSPEQNCHQIFPNYFSQILKTINPAIAISAPITFFQLNGSFSTPKSPNNSIRYATISCAITISITAFAGPNESMLLITVNVINAPIAPPSRTYFGSTERTSLNEVLSTKSHAAIQTKNAVNCTNTFAAQRLEPSVTFPDINLTVSVFKA